MDQNNVGQPGVPPGAPPGDQQPPPGDQQPPPVPEPPTREQMAAAIQMLEQRTQQLGIQAEARRLTDEQKGKRSRMQGNEPDAKVQRRRSIQNF